MMPSTSELARKIREIVREAEGRVVIVGVGNVLRGDDAAGVLLVRKLREAGFEDNIIIAEQSPEAFTDIILSKEPKVVFFIDGVNGGLSPGSLILMELPSKASQGMLYSHKIPLSFVASYLKWRKRDLRVFLVGIQVKTIEIGAPVSSEVKKGIEALAKIFVSVLKEVANGLPRFPN